MADADKTLITRAQLTSLITAGTGRVRLTLDGQNVELGTTGWRDVSGLLTNVDLITAGSLVVIRTGNVVTIKVKTTPTSGGNVALGTIGAAFAPDTTLYTGGRVGPLAVDTNGRVYATAAVANRQEDGVLTFVTDNAWPTTLPGVPLGDPVVA